MTGLESIGAIAAACGVSVLLVERLAESELLPRESDGSVGVAAERRLRLLSFALSRGITEDDLIRAMRAYGDLLAAFDDMAPPPLPDADSDALGAQLGLAPGLVHEIADAIGAGPEELLTADDVEALRSAKRALDLGLPVGVLLELLRVFAANMERLAEAESRIFHDNVHEPLRGQGLSGRPLLEATAAVGNGLLELVEPTVVYFHRRAWARAARLDFLRHLTEDSRPPATAPGASSCAVMFADLSGFTPLTAAMGDDAAAEVLVRFAAAVRRLTDRHDGRVVKQIGDAFMLVFDQPRNAVLCGVGLLDWCAAEPRFPPVHIGAHAGEVLFREGDFVGAVVNAAARVASATAPGQFFVTDDVLHEADLPPEVQVVARGPQSLKGLPAPLELSSVAVAHDDGTTPTMQRDPVCGMSVEHGVISTSGMDVVWSFCSSRCADAFSLDPERYRSSGQPTG